MYLNPDFSKNKQTYTTKNGTLTKNQLFNSFVCSTRLMSDFKNSEP